MRKTPHSPALSGLPASPPLSPRVRGSAATLRKNIFFLKNDRFRLVKYSASRTGMGHFLADRVSYVHATTCRAYKRIWIEFRETRLARLERQMWSWVDPLATD